MDDLIAALAEQIENDERRTSMLNLKRALQIKCVEEVLEMIAEENGLKASTQMNEPLTSMGSVSIIGKDISLTTTKDIEAFLSAVGYASNFDVYPRTDGKICMTVTFHGLTVPIE